MTKAKGHLPRLSPEFYRGHAFIFWTHAVANRGTGWLCDKTHAAFRETMLHASVRENLLCSIYVLMPDHIHLVWIGVTEGGDQRAASTFLRTHFAPSLAPQAWQHQPHDHVLRDTERQRGAFESTCHYIAENPVRKHLSPSASDWTHLGCIVPGYPALHPLADDFWPLFWRIHAANADRGHVGKI